jgi:hypothetical protein
MSNTQRTEQTRIYRHQHHAYSQARGHTASVLGTRTAKSNQRVINRIIALLQRDTTDGIGHSLVRYFDKTSKQGFPTGDLTASSAQRSSRFCKTRLGVLAVNWNTKSRCV